MCEAERVLLGDGDGFVSCDCGHRHWGLHGAAGLLLCDPDRGVLLQRRAWWVHHGRTWALPGGALRRSETATQAALREAAEEAGVPADAVELTAAADVEHGAWRYTTVLGTVRRPVAATVTSTETAGMRWVAPEDVTGFRLHHDFATVWPLLRRQLDRRLVLVVDGANVVGSRPDGWWRDRKGAAARLRDALAGLAVNGIASAADGVPDPAGPDLRWRWLPRIVLVVEGQARPTESVDGVEVVAAEADGDSTIVDVAMAAGQQRPDDDVLVATADRGLRERIAEVGAAAIGPGVLRAQLPS